MAGTMALIPSCLAVSAALVKSTLPKGTDVSRTPTLPPACWKDCAVCSAARADEGEMP